MPLRPGSDALARLEAAQAALDAIEEDRAEAVAERDRAVTDARREGINVGAIADTLRVDRQTVYKVLRRQP